jgi:HSP20 family protein
VTLSRRTSPFGEFLSLRQAMDRLLEDSFVRPRGSYPQESEFGIPLDVADSQDALVIEAALPGVAPDDVDITVLGDTLSITATSQQERSADEDGYVYREVRRGRFSRTVTLPSQVQPDRASATFEHGMLRLSIPKAEAAKPRQIRIGTTGDAPATRVEAGSQPEAGSQAEASSSSAR